MSQSRTVAIIAGFITLISLSVLTAVGKTEKLKPIAISGQMQTFEIPSWGNGSPPVFLDIPVGFVMIRDSRVDFDVYHVSSQSPKWGASMGLYFGHNPGSRWPATASEEPGKAGQGPIVWHFWSENRKGGPIYHRETLIEGFFLPHDAREKRPLNPDVPLPPPPPPPPPPGPPDPTEVLTIHVFISGASPDSVKAMGVWISSLRRRR